MFRLLMVCSLLVLVSAWNQPSTCYVRQSSCSGDSEFNNDIQRIRETLEGSISVSLSSIASSLKQLVDQNDAATVPPPTIATPTNPVSEMTTTSEATTSEPLTEPTTSSGPSIGTIANPASSCNEIPPDRPSGEYWIVTDSTSTPVRVYCDMNRTSCSCNTAGGWTRVANLDMTDPDQNCPDGFRLVSRSEPPLRTCGRHGQGCVSTSYSTHGIAYSNICGKVIGYQFGFLEAFGNIGQPIDGTYVEGVSLTHGRSPREHIWTFASARDELQEAIAASCPCINPQRSFTHPIPDFIGNDYFCDTGTEEAQAVLNADNPLWDGEGCEGANTCCQFNNPPWFCKQLPLPTTDDIELRICADFFISDEDTPIESVEIYIQ